MRAVRSYANRHVAVAIAVVLAACTGVNGGDTAPLPPPLVVTVTNRLDVAVAVSAGGTPLGSLVPQESRAFTLPPAATAVTWTNTKRTRVDGAAIADELDAVTVPVGPSGSAVEITNVVGGATYFSPVIFQQFPDTVAIEVARGSATACLGWQFGRALLGMKWGYHVLTPDLQLRYYRGTACRAGAAPFGSWSAVTIGSRLTPGTGLVTLTADVLP